MCWIQALRKTNGNSHYRGEFHGSAAGRELSLLPPPVLTSDTEGRGFGSRVCLTVFLVETTMALVSDNAVFASRQLKIVMEVSN